MVAAAEAVLLIAVAAGWLGTAAGPGYADRLVLLGAASAASGMQSVVTISRGVRGASTTYLTGSLTDMVRAVVLGSAPVRRRRGWDQPAARAARRRRARWFAAARGTALDARPGRGAGPGRRARRRRLRAAKGWSHRPEDVPSPVMVAITAE
jgi:Protein of unknown function (DUF1275)